MAGPRWDELERSIRAKDSEAAERIWLELVEQDSGNIDGFLKAADGIAEKAGGRRQAGVLLWMVAGALKDKGRDRDLFRLHARLAKIAPDDGTLRQAMTEAVRRGWAGRADLDALLDRSGVVGGTASELAKQAEALERYLRLEPGAYVFHKTGWGIGKIVEYSPEKGKCTIDFLSKRGHLMDLLAAADLLERLRDDDLLVMKAYKRDELAKQAAERPLDVLRHVLVKLGGDAPLRHVKDLLIPDVIDKTAWAGWWREAKKQATLDPAFTIGAGTDPRITFTEGGSADFTTLLQRQLSFAQTPLEQQKTIREFTRIAGTDAGARAVLAQQAKTDLARAHPTDISTRLAWSVILADLEGVDATSELAPTFAGLADPRPLLKAVHADDARALASKACLQARPTDGPAFILELALAEDLVLADVFADHALAKKDNVLLERLLGPVFADPMARPLLYEWATRGLVRSRWPGRRAEPARTAEQVLKVLDGTAYASRREGSERKAKAVEAMANLLADRNCRIMADACSAVDDEGARHLLRLINRNQGLKPRLQEKLEDTILRSHPQALAATRVEPTSEAPLTEIYVTAAGIEKMRREYDKIVNEEMPANASEIQRAREFGDLSENAEYHAAREKQGMLQARSNMIKSTLSLAREIRPEIIRTDAVSVGCRVRLRDPAGKEVTYTLLGPADIDVKRGIINYQTPLGQSLMGKRPGETVNLEVMGDKHTYQVLEIASGL